MTIAAQAETWLDIPDVKPNFAEKFPVCTVMMSYLPGGSIVSYMTARRELAEWVSAAPSRECTLKISSDFLSLRLDHHEGGRWKWAGVGKSDGKFASYRLRLGVMNFWPPEIRGHAGVTYETTGTTLLARLPPDWNSSKAPGLLAGSGAKVSVPEYVGTFRFSLSERWVMEQLILERRRCGTDYLCEQLSLERPEFNRLVTGLSKKLRQAVIIHEGIVTTSNALSLSLPDRERLGTAIAEARQASRG